MLQPSLSSKGPHNRTSPPSPPATGSCGAKEGGGRGEGGMSLTIACARQTLEGGIWPRRLCSKNAACNCSTSASLCSYTTASQTHMRGATNIEPDHDGARVWLLLGGKTVQIAIRRTNKAAGQRRGGRQRLLRCQPKLQWREAVVTRHITRQQYHCF